MNRLAVLERRLLILYWSPEGGRLRTGVENHLRALWQLPGRNRLIAYNATQGAPSWLGRFQPDAVILHTTFLALRWIEGFERRRRRSEWIAGLRCPKLALPQDDYDHSAVLDAWLDELGVDVVFTPLAEHANSLLPLTARRAQIRKGLTGYVDDAAVRDRPRPSRLKSRSVDVVYRATELPYWFGSHGRLKHRIGLAAAEKAAHLGLRADISTRPEDAIVGARWLDFLASGRAVVGAEGGSSVVDPSGSVRQAVREALRSEPHLSFEELSERMPTGWDAHRLVALSPRHLEAAVAGTAQLLVEGRYDDVLEAGRHYLPLRADFSDLEDALAETRDPRGLQRLADAAYEEICLSGRYSYRRLAEEIDECLRELGAGERRRLGLGAHVGPVLAGMEGELTRRSARAVSMVLEAVHRPRRP